MEKIKNGLIIGLTLLLVFTFACFKAKSYQVDKLKAEHDVLAQITNSQNAAIDNYKKEVRKEAEKMLHIEKVNHKKLIEAQKKEQDIYVLRPKDCEEAMRMLATFGTDFAD